MLKNAPAYRQAGICCVPPACRPFAGVAKVAPYSSRRHSQDFGSLASACLREAASAKAGAFLSILGKNYFFSKLLGEKGSTMSCAEPPLSNIST